MSSAPVKTAQNAITQRNASAVEPGQSTTTAPAVM